MRTTIQFLSDAAIEIADIVSVIDPNRPTFSQQLYGQDSVPPIIPAGTPAREVNVLEIEIDSTDDAQLQDLIAKVESIKGHLPQDVLRLKNPE